MTTLAVGAAIAACLIIVVAAVVVVRRLRVGPAPTVDLSDVTVSRQWLMQHQSNDWS
jgi:hypothetical protein